MDVTVYYCRSSSYLIFWNFSNEEGTTNDAKLWNWLCETLKVNFNTNSFLIENVLNIFIF